MPMQPPSYNHPCLYPNFGEVFLVRRALVSLLRLSIRFLESKFGNRPSEAWLQMKVEQTQLFMVK